MPAEAHGLDKTDILAVAAYYSGLKPVKAAGGAAPAAVNPATGAKISVSAAKALFDMDCAKCHDNGGRGDKAGGFPDLTLQTAPYLAQSLYTFRTRARPNAQMLYVIDSLSFDEMAGLADYLGGLKPQPALLKPNTAATPGAASIATKGIPDRGVPACLSCHDANGVAELPLIPRLQGQSPLYLRNRLNNFAKPYNVNLSALNPMPAIAGRLTDQERADLAAYFAAAAPLDKPAAR
jgi:cytochrome c553